MMAIVYLYGPLHMARPAWISVLAHRSDLPWKTVNIGLGAMTIVLKVQRWAPYMTPYNGWLLACI